MARQKSLKGAARLGPGGNFELYLGGASGTLKAPCISEPLREYVREYYDFLCSRDVTRQIGEVEAFKTRTKTGKMMTSFTFLDGFNVRLIKGEGEFATFILELPFVGGTIEDDENSGFAAGEEEDPDAEFAGSQEASYDG